MPLIKHSDNPRSIILLSYYCHYQIWLKIVTWYLNILRVTHLIAFKVRVERHIFQQNANLVELRVNCLCLWLILFLWLLLLHTSSLFWCFDILLELYAIFQLTYMDKIQIRYLMFICILDHHPSPTTRQHVSFAYLKLLLRMKLFLQTQLRFVNTIYLHWHAS